MYFLTPELYFPPSSETSPEGIIAVGGDLSSERLLLAYQNGIFLGMILMSQNFGGVQKKGWYYFLKIYE